MSDHEVLELRSSLTLLYEFCCGLNDFRPDSPLGRKCRAAIAFKAPRCEVQTETPARAEMSNLNDPERALVEKCKSEGFQSSAGCNLVDLVRRAGLTLFFRAAQQALPTRCDNCGRAFLPDDTVFASVNHGVRRTVHLRCGGQTATDRGKLSDDKIMDILRKVTKGQLYDLLTCKRWKDGIDIDAPTFAAQWLALEFHNANAVSDRTPAHTSALVDQITNIVSDYYDEDEAGRYRKCAQHIADSIQGAAQASRPRAFLSWAVEMFGPVAKLRSERLLRFVEEAIELAHAEGMEREVFNKVADRVYSRPAGDTPKEIGQAQACLETFAENIGLSSADEAEREWRRVQGIPQEEWTRRHAAKQALGIALPSADREADHG